jgi:hypothetical protein
MRARSLDAPNTPIPASSKAKSPEEVLEARRKLAEDMERYISGRVTDTISYLDTGSETLPTQPSPNPEEPDEPK